MDTAGYSKWDGRQEEVPGGMSKGAASEIPLGPSLASGLGFNGEGRGFLGGSSGKEPPCQCRRRKRRGFDSWIRKIPGEGHDNPLQYSCLENPVE